MDYMGKRMVMPGTVETLSIPWVRPCLPLFSLGLHPGL